MICFQLCLLTCSYKFNDFWDDLVRDTRALEEKAERKDDELTAKDVKLYTALVFIIKQTRLTPSAVYTCISA